MLSVASFQGQPSAQKIVTEQKHKEQGHKNSSLWPLDLLPLGLVHPALKRRKKKIAPRVARQTVRGKVQTRKYLGHIKKAYQMLHCLPQRSGSRNRG